MSKYFRAVVLAGTALCGLMASANTQADMITQTVTLPLTQTNFSAGTSGITNNPMVFQQFDTVAGTRTLDSVTLNFGASITNSFSMRFINSATITDSVATGDPSNPGPSITLYQPNGTTALLVVQTPNDPSFLTRSVTYGSAGQTFPQTFSSSLDPSSPYYLAPATKQASNSITTTSPANLSLFTGTGSIGLPVAASAYGSFMSSSGNGFGRINTSATANVTVIYNWHLTQSGAQTIPEPSSFVLAGLGGIGLLFLRRPRLAA